MSVFYMCSWGLGAWDKEIACTKKKKTFIPYIYITSNKDPFNNSSRNVVYKFKNSHSNGYLTSFDVFIAHVICPTAGLLVDRGLSGIDSGFNEGNMIPL